MPRPKIIEERREEILKAFEACIVRKGFAETTLADVAYEAGHPRPLVRYFIGNRDEMVSCLIERILTRGESRAKSLLSRKTSYTLEELADILLDQIYVDNTTKVIIMELWHLAIRDEALRVKLSSLYRRLVLEVVNKIKDYSSDTETKKIYDAALSATSLAVGMAFLNHIELKTNDPFCIRSHIVDIISDAGVKTKTRLNTRQKRERGRKS